MLNNSKTSNRDEQSSPVTFECLHDYALLNCGDEPFILDGEEITKVDPSYSINGNPESEVAVSDQKFDNIFLTDGKRVIVYLGNTSYQINDIEKVDFEFDGMLINEDILTGLKAGRETMDYFLKHDLKVGNTYFGTDLLPVDYFYLQLLSDPDFCFYEGLYRLVVHLNNCYNREKAVQMIGLYKKELEGILSLEESEYLDDLYDSINSNQMREKEYKKILKRCMTELEH